MKEQLINLLKLSNLFKTNSVFQDLWRMMTSQLAILIYVVILLLLIIVMIAFMISNEVKRQQVITVNQTITNESDNEINPSFYDTEVEETSDESRFFMLTQIDENKAKFETLTY